MLSDAEKGASSSSAESATRLSKEEIRVVRVELEDEDENAGVQIYNPDVDVSGVDERKLMRKVDIRLVPWLSFLFLLSFLDRTAVGNARVSRLTPV